MENVEYRVRPVTRYVVTRFYQTKTLNGDQGGCDLKGEFDNLSSAEEVARALAAHETDYRPDLADILLRDGDGSTWRHSAGACAWTQVDKGTGEKNPKSLGC